MDDYTLLDFGDLRRLEQWGPVRTIRPDPRAVGGPQLEAPAWAAADAVYEGRSGRGAWRARGETIAEPWTVSHDGLRFEVKLAPSMHTGLFPEQAAHWRWMRGVLASAPPIDVLNLFAYTGGASVALGALGCRVTHVDASKPAVGWARRNAALNGVSTIRWIADDVRAFVRRERRRGRQYQALILDPPAFGRGASGPWQLRRDLESLLDEAIALLSPDAAFVLLNVYDIDAQVTPTATLHTERLAAARHGLADVPVDAASLDLRTADGRPLPTGVFARVAAQNRRRASFFDSRNP
jgi:23S rRNA (cytosine1962-C5)-methyltransferase